MSIWYFKIKFKLILSNDFIFKVEVLDGHAPPNLAHTPTHIKKPGQP